MDSRAYSAYIFILARSRLRSKSSRRVLDVGVCRRYAGLICSLSFSAFYALKCVREIKTTFAVISFVYASSSRFTWRNSSQALVTNDNRERKWRRKMSARELRLPQVNKRSA